MRTAGLRASLDSLLRLATVGSVLLLTGCAPKAAPQQSMLMQQAQMEVTVDELRARVHILANQLTGMVKEVADQIRAESEDPTVRRRALTWKMDAIPAYHTAAFRADPLAATIDVWVLTLQMKDYFTEGAGRHAFGREQELALAATSRMLAAVEAAARETSTNEERFERGRKLLMEWARDHPIERSFATRLTATKLVVELLGSDGNAFQAIGQIQDTVEDLSVRLNSYAAHLPEQMRWQAELLTEEVMASDQAERALIDIHTLAGAAQSLQGVTDGLPDALNAATGVTREMLDQQRRAALGSIQAQRLETLDFAVVQRDTIIAALRSERELALDLLREERIAALRDAETISQRTVGSIMGELRILVDYVLLRVAVLLLVAIAGGGVLIWFGNRSRGSAARASPS